VVQREKISKHIVSKANKRTSKAIKTIKVLYVEDSLIWRGIQGELEVFPKY